MPRRFPISSTASRSTRPTATPTSIPRTSATSSASSRARRARISTPPSPRRDRRSPKWSQSTPQQRFDVLDRAGTEILARKDELGRLLSREQGKPLADGIGEAARAGAIFKFFAGEARARRRREDRLRPARHRRRGHARAARRRRRDHAVELSARDSGLEDRAGAGVRQHASCSSRPSSCRRRPGRSSTSSSAPACRRACSIS